jgi:hypothetical protein
MLIELGGSTASQSGTIISYATFARAAQVVLLLVATLVVLHYRTIFAQWRSAVYTVPAITWLLSRLEANQPVVTSKPAAVQLVVDKRLSLDDAESRRLSRAEFLQENQDFDYGMSTVISSSSKPNLQILSLFASHHHHAVSFGACKSDCHPSSRHVGLLFPPQAKFCGFAQNIVQRISCELLVLWHMQTSSS